MDTPEPDPARGDTSGGAGNGPHNDDEHENT